MRRSQKRFQSEDGEHGAKSKIRSRHAYRANESVVALETERSLTVETDEVACSREEGRGSGGEEIGSDGLAKWFANAAVCQ